MADALTKIVSPFVHMPYPKEERKCNCFFSAEEDELLLGTNCKEEVMAGAINHAQKPNGGGESEEEEVGHPERQEKG